MYRHSRGHLRISLLVAIGGHFLFTCAPTYAMPPANGLNGAEQRAAERLLDAARDRGVSDLPASPFLRPTNCGRATTIMRNRTGRRNAASGNLRRAVRRHAGVAAARRALRAADRALAAASRARTTACVPQTSSSLNDPEFGDLEGTATMQRPQSVLSGRGMVIALPIDFRDVQARRATNTPSRYEQLFFDPAYPFGGGSLATFWSDMSFGSYTVAGNVAGWKRMPGTRGSYSHDSGGMGAYPGNSQGLLEDAVAANDSTVNFALYDNDGPDGRPNSGDDDGFVDAVFLVYAGTSAAENGDLDTMWPHAWRHDVTTHDRSANGGMIRVNRYAALPERMEHDGPDGDLLTVGVAAHEYGHVLGLPDLIDGEQGPGVGQWDLMGSGLWGFQNSARPTGLSAWSRARLGWLTPQLIEGDHLGHSLGSSYARRTAVKLPIDGKPMHEHFLVERRTRTGFDADLPGTGLLVWHIDDSIAADDASGHPRIELVAADDRADGNAGDMLNGNDGLSDASSPDLKAHDGNDSLVAIQNVAQDTVDLHAGRASLAPVIDRDVAAAGPQAAAPTAVLNAPADGARVRGTITMSCTGTGNPNINRITFYRDSTVALTNIAVLPTAATTTQTFGFNTATRPDGPNALACRARNTSNQWSAYEIANVIIDNTLPATPSITAPTAASWVRGTTNYTASGTDNYGVTRFSYRVDGVDNWQGPWPEATPQTQTYAWNTTLATNGAHTLTLKSEDLAGNQSAISTGVAVNVDNTLPTLAAPRDGSIAPDIASQVSTTTLNANWNAGSDTFSGMASYTWRFCTSPACGTVVASGSGAGLAASATGLSLSNTTYYACVKPVDVAGNVGVEQCSNGVLVDSTAPTMPVPNDGATAPDVDGQVSTTTLNANWSAANDGTGVGVSGYDWRFCTTPACGTILASGSGAGLTATAGALTLTNGSTYYACVRAKDTLNNTSSYVCSDGVLVDTAAPTVPTPNDGTVAPDRDYQASTTTLNANWSAATDVSGVASYDWRVCPTPACGSVLGSGSGAGLSASAGSLSLTNGSTYYACVRATDTLGNVSAYVCSDGIAIDTAVPTTGTPKDGATAPDIATQTSTTQLDLNWLAGNDGAGSGVATYDWRFCTSPACGTVLASGTTAGLTASASSLSLTVGATYYACVRATDVVANVGAWTCSNGVTVDDGPPVMSTPTDGVSLPDKAFQVSTTTLDAIWPAATDGNGVASYDWRFCTAPACGSILASGSGTGLSATAGSLTLSNGSSYVACVRAIDTLGTASAYACSNGVLVDTAAATMSTPNDGPTAPDIATQTSTSQLDANWSAANDGAGSGVASYDWRFCTSPACGTVLASGSGGGTASSASSLALSAGATYYACVRAVDQVGNVSAYSCSNGVLVDTGPPTMSTPTDGTALPDVDFQLSTSTLNAIWPAATDDVAVTGYDWRFCTTPACGSILASGSGAGLSATASSLSLTNGSTYYACARANDGASNSSAYVCSDGVAVDSAAPVPATPNDGVAADVAAQSSTTQLDANWSAANDGTGSGTASYDWRFCPTPACGSILASGSGAGTTASASSLTLTPGSTYYACVRASDLLGNVSTYTCSDGVQVTNMPPTMSTPTDGAALPDIDFQLSTNTLNAIWPVATDDVAVTGYDWRFCTTPACGSILASGSGAGLSATAGSLSLTNGSTYYACARANDGGGASSAYVCSDGVKVDTAAPTMPTPNDGVSAPDVDGQVSTTQLDANWNAASDGTGSGTAGYDWRFCTTPACGTIVASGSGAATTTTASSLSLTFGATYYACVRAADQLANTSGWTCSDGVVAGDPAPTMSTPTDGTALPDKDAQNSLTTLAAIWPAATDNGTVTGYDWRFCTSPACGTVVASGSGAGLSTTVSSLALSNGTTYYACVRATDNVANQSAYLCSDGILVDTTAPTAPTQSGATGTVSGIVNFQSSSADAGGVDRVEYRVDGTTAVTASGGGATSFTDPGTPFNTVTLLDGNHAWRSFTFDLAGNSTPAGTPTQFVVNNDPDTSMPSGVVTSPANSTTLPATNVSLTVNITPGDVIVKIEWLLDGALISGIAADQPPAGFTSGTRTKTWASTGGVAAGPHTISARLTDADGDVVTTAANNVTK